MCFLMIKYVPEINNAVHTYDLRVCIQDQQ